MATSCDFLKTEDSTKSLFRTKKLVDDHLNILNLKEFKKENAKWSTYAQIHYNIPKGEKLFRLSDDNKKAIPNVRIFQIIDAARNLWYSNNEYLRKDNPNLEVNALFESNPELANQVYSIMGINTINEAEITYTDEEGNPCAKTGLSNTIKGTGWRVVKDFKGKPKHSQGGVDITISDKGIFMRRGGKDIKAKHGLVIPGDPPEYDMMSKVLTQRNKHLNWVKRGINPENYPVIDNGDGTVSTHKLAYSTGDNGEAYVYPTIIQLENGELKQLSPEKAMKYARKTKTAMVVPNVKLAKYYSENGLIKH